jgi:hypothetical protein
VRLREAVVLGDLTENIFTATVNLQKAVIAGNKKDMEKSIEDVLSTRKNIDNDFDKLKTFVQSEKSNSFYQAMLDARKPTAGREIK